ncbi:MAG: phosphatase PAP2 family protein [Bacteroidota bacterium]
MKLLMQLVSAVFHPLLLSTHMMVVLYFTAPEIIGSIGVEYIPNLILAIFLSTAVIPAMSIGFMKVSSRISNYEMTQREERMWPFLLITIFYAATTYFMISQFRVGDVFALMMITVSILIFALLLITLRFKISIHAAASWGGAGIISFLFVQNEAPLFVPLMITFLAAGAVGTSRLYLGYHTPKEIWTGSLFGFGFCFLVLNLFG